MKILRIDFKNLNSLAGEWKIDFTRPEFVANGIFVITGPTGSGKTTILDALCLALYGQTPRLGKITAGENEIMSRHSGDCFAEATFLTQTGTYRAHWSQRRARKKPDGQLQPPKHEIVDAETGTVLEAKARDTANRIEEITGMDFGRFTRSMLLAQGDFAVFLQAAPDERAPILEQITGSEIYSRISIRVHERQRREKDALDRLAGEAGGIVLLDPDVKSGLEAELGDLRAEESTVAGALDAVRKALAWHARIAELENDLSGLTGEAETLAGEMRAFAPDRERLRAADRAAGLDGSYAALLALRKRRDDDRKECAEKTESLPGLESAARRDHDALKAAEGRKIAADRELADAAPALQKTRLLDSVVSGKTKEIADLDRERVEAEERLTADREAKTALIAERVECEQELERIAAYLAAHAGDERLVGDFTGIEEQLTAVGRRRREIDEKEGELDAARKSLGKAEKLREDRRKERAARAAALAAAENARKQGADELRRVLNGRLLREYQAEVKALHRESALCMIIAELGELRGKLADGEPCPLCGATKHPYAEGNIPAVGEIETKIAGLDDVIGRAQKMEDAAAIHALEEAKARERFSEIEKLEIAADSGVGAAADAVSRINGELEKLHDAFAERKRAVAARASPYVQADAVDADAAAVIESLRARLDVWRERAAAKGELERRLNEIGNELNRLRALEEAGENALAEKRRRLARLRDERSKLAAEREELFADKDPDAEEKKLRDAASARAGDEKRLTVVHHDSQIEVTTTRYAIADLAGKIEILGKELKQKEADFAAELAAAGFDSEEGFLADRISANAREELSREAKRLDDRDAWLRATRSDRESRLARERENAPGRESAAALAEQAAGYEEALRNAREKIVGVRNRLEENAAANERHAAALLKLERQRSECRRWDDLRELIGSADGKKFRNFAQGLTLETMIDYSNRQLAKMTDRYLLAHDRRDPLALGVVDNYLGGAVRSAKNLSGGESFIVSLALALGLSRMASRNVRIDSLFLDEGFGTLDDEALDTALDALSGLRQDGKTIGVISHVAALKERIAVQIQATPLPGGRSRIDGPGTG